jgi:2,3-diketo-5-methylthio-1-phosphopentane phosphatase
MQMLCAANIHAGNDPQVIVTNPVIGQLWTTGFSNGDLKTPLFEDVVPTLEAWKTAGKTLAIFSSGSVQAQLQFFSYVRDGDSTRDIKHLFSAHYDTVNAGPKLEKASYLKICTELGYDVTKVTFLTDNVKGTFLTAHCFSYTRDGKYRRVSPAHPSSYVLSPFTIYGPSVEYGDRCFAHGLSFKLSPRLNHQFH